MSERSDSLRLLDRYRQFMIGRYGTDQLNMALLVVYVILSIIYSFSRWGIVLFAGYAIVVLLFYRSFSKNTSKRWKENQKFLSYYQPIANRLKGKAMSNRTSSKGAFRSAKTSAKLKSDKEHKVFQCGKCGQLIRVPRGKGKIAITCPKCKQEFIKRT